MEQLASQLTETEAMLRRRKAQVAQMIAAGQQATAAELTAIARLELQCANLRMLIRAHELST